MQGDTAYFYCIDIWTTDTPADRGGSRESVVLLGDALHAFSGLCFGSSVEGLELLSRFYC